MRWSHAWLGIWVLLAGGARPGRAEEEVPCYNCRDDRQCPRLEAPRCTQKSALPPKVRPRTRSAEDARRDARREAARREAAAQRQAEEQAQQKAQEEARAADLRRWSAPMVAPLPVVHDQATVPRGRPLRPWGIGLLVSGGVALGAGAALLAVDGRFWEQCRTPGVPSTCQSVLTTQAGGVTLSVIGGAALVTGVILLVLNRVHGSHGASLAQRKPTAK